MELVFAEEIRRGWQPGPLLSQRRQPEEGCDFFSVPPDGNPAHPVEVKGWGAPFIDDLGRFSFPAEVLVEQLDRARRDSNWRLEIVANLTAARTRRCTARARSVEFDEVQHFNRYRALTLRSYPSSARLAFPKRAWIEHCEVKRKLEGGGFGKPKPPLSQGRADVIANAPSETRSLTWCLFPGAGSQRSALLTSKSKAGFGPPTPSGECERY